MPDVLHLDFETYSTLDLRAVGAYRYARDPSTEVLICCYALNNGPIRTWVVRKAHSAMPADLLQAARNSKVLFAAHNAEFEREIWRNVLAPDISIPRARWRCSAVRAARTGIPRSLEGACATLALPAQKDKRGKALIRLFCIPRKPTKKLAATRILPEDRPKEFQEFIEYCRQDVRAERALMHALPDLSPDEWKHYHYNMLINDRGLPLDMQTIEHAAKALRIIEQDNQKRVRHLTEGINPTQVAKIGAWLEANEHKLPNLQLKTIVKSIDSAPNKKVREVLELRLEASKASTKKIKAMSVVACADARAHGCFLAYGAHTGRLSGRLIQPQNFTRGFPAMDPVDAGRLAAQVLRAFGTGDADTVRMLFDNPMDKLAQSMRGFIQAVMGQRFLVADFAAIETRILAWLAGELKVLDAYRRKLDLYKMMAMVLYHVTYDGVTKEQRRIGKNLRLGAGFQLGVDGLLKNCAKEEIPMTRDFAAEAIRVYRDDNPHIVNFWYAMNDAAIAAVGGHATTVRNIVSMHKWRDWLVITLPSGRNLWYYDPKVEVVMKWGKMRPQVSYFEQQKGNYAVHNNRMRTYGGKLTENVVQAVAWDCMINGMLAAERAGYPVIGSIHDEAITMRPDGEGTVQELERVVCTLPKWAKELPLVAEGFECTRYRKG